MAVQGASRSRSSRLPWRRGSGESLVVTSAAVSRSDDQRTRQRRYFMSQGLRVVCILLQAFPLPGWLRVVLILAAVLLPWAGVVQANAGPAQTVQRRPAGPAVAVPTEAARPALGSARVIDADPLD